MQQILQCICNFNILDWQTIMEVIFKVEQKHGNDIFGSAGQTLLCKYFFFFFKKRKCVWLQPANNHQIYDTSSLSFDSLKLDSLVFQGYHIHPSLTAGVWIYLVRAAPLWELCFKYSAEKFSADFNNFECLEDEQPHPFAENLYKCPRTIISIT